jgi:hypothetical protein
MSPRVHMDQFEFLIKNLTPGLPDMMRLFCIPVPSNLRLFKARVRIRGNSARSLYAK